MKRALAFLLSFIYLSASMGASIHLHYCMGKLISWEFINHESKNCAYCGMPKEGGKTGIVFSNKCCSDKQQELKTGSDQQLTPGEFQWVKVLPHISPLYKRTAPEYPGSLVLATHPVTHAPPVSGGQPVFLRNCNFRI